MQQMIKPFGLRLPPDLKSWLSEMAHINRRSLNSELIRRLEESREAEQQKCAETTKKP
jgi:predicted HicB family RNase H-like nuclease